MQIVINIPEETYEALVINQYCGSKSNLENIIANGTPLPKGHGRIIDESKITKLYTYVPNSFCKGGGWKTEDFNATNTDAPTIIEADKESKE